MKEIKNILKFLLLILVVASCQDDEYAVEYPFVDASYTSSFGAGATGGVAVDSQYLSFLDLSSGATKHEWRIPESAFFLQGPIDQNLTNFDDLIINRGETVTTDKSIHVLFTEGNSDTEVILYNEFPEYTEFVQVLFVDGLAMNDTIKTIKVGDKWVYEQTVLIDVFANVEPTFEVRDELGDLIDHEAMDTIYLNFDDKLEFTDITASVNNARPDGRTWRFLTIEENPEDEKIMASGTNEVQEIAFNKGVGNFRGELISRRSRTPEIEGSEETLNMSVVFKVSPLTTPFVQNGVIEETDADVIMIPFSGKFAELEDSITPFFSVKIDGVDSPIASISINETNKSILDLSLETALTPDDASKSVTVSYDGQGEIFTLDGRELQIFTDAAIVVYEPTPVNIVGDVVEPAFMSDRFSITFDQALDPATIASSADATVGFDVQVNGSSAAIASVSVNASNEMMLDVVLTDGVYRADVISVAYTGPGDIKSIGGGRISDFTAQTVIMNEDDLLEGLGSFEDASQWTTGGTSGGGTVTFEALPTAPKGDHVVRFEAPGGGKSKITASGGKTIPLVGGTVYLITAKRYIASTTDTAFGKFIVGGVTYNDQWGAVARDVWTDVEIEFTPASDTNAALAMQSIPAGVSDVRYDDWQIKEKNARP
ncbi:SwmB domain-containing protein [Flavicella marina]|uniref:SwmB domain-containing protein n=1 Tax=Flavicella marina TaxID=1475951 RepID=UPI0012654A13|nr:SwmB domain-containing protein [Flavicella marina]